jgi:pimeloyl-ACP methyl ester carboxylesterase
MSQNTVRPFGFRLKKRWFLIGLFFCLVTLTRCIRLHKTDREIEKHFKDAPVKPRFHTYVQDGWPIHYAEIGADSLPTVVFIHGSPGSWDAFIGFFKDTTLYTKARLVSVDRPGYGKSDYGSPEMSLRQQAALLAPVLRTNRNPKKPVLVGHSLGGPVAARLAMDYPKLTGGLVLVAASVDPGQEKNEWYRHVGEWALVRKLLPTEFDVSNREILPLKGELTKMLPLWKNIRVPVTVIHGDADVLVPFANAAFSKKMLVHAPVEMVVLPKVNHFIPWSHPQVIRQAVLQQLKLEVRKR